MAKAPKNIRSPGEPLVWPTALMMLLAIGPAALLETPPETAGFSSKSLRAVPDYEKMRAENADLAAFVRS
jgi:hypothetical protein